MIGKMGVLELSVHTVPNQVTMFVGMCPFAFGTALAIRMGVTLTNSVTRAKKIVFWTTVGSVILFGGVVCVMYAYADIIFSIFTRDKEVVSLAHKIWWKVCLFNFNVAIFAIFAGVATGLGMVRSSGAPSVICLHTTETLMNTSCPRPLSFSWFKNLCKNSSSGSLGL